MTGGYIGHAVTVANTKVYNGFYDDNPNHALMHGPTFMGNALACSVALKSIELFENQDYISKIHKIEEITKRELKDFEDNRIKEIRIMGGCVCIEVHDPYVLKVINNLLLKMVYLVDHFSIIFMLWFLILLQKNS